MIPSEEKSRLPVAFIVGLVVVTLLIGAAVWLSKYSTPVGPQAEVPLPMGSTEQAYASQITFLEPKMSRAANFLNQEVTFIFGSVQNSGSRSVKQIEVTLEFHDVFNQIVQREKQRLFEPNDPSLKPGEMRDFQITYEHISAQWNQVYPSIRVSGLDLK